MLTSSWLYTLSCNNTFLMLDLIGGPDEPLDAFTQDRKTSSQDALQMRRDMSDIPLLRQLTEILGGNMWYNAMVLMTHATAQGPLTPEGQAIPYESRSQMRAQLFQRAVQ